MSNYSQGEADRVDAIVKRAEQLRSDRSTLDSHLDEVALRVAPNYSGKFFGSETTKYDKNTEEQFDSTAAVALTRFTSAFESMLTPRNGMWHRLMPSNPDLSKDRQVQLWFDDVNRLLFKYRYAPMANFASQVNETYWSLGAFGTGSLFVDDLMVDGRKDGIRYSSLFLGEVYFCVNHQGIVDTLYRPFKLNIRQIQQKFGDKVPEDVVKKYASKPDTELTVIHCVKPNEERDDRKIDYRGMAYSSEYVLPEGKVILQEGGYNTFPVPVSRYVTTPGEIYGRSPAMMVLPAIKVLNEEKKTVLKQGHRITDPVLLAHDDGIMDSFDITPGAVNYGGVSADGRELVKTLPTGNLAIARDMMIDERELINDVFLVTLFQILVDTPQMTATEVMERAREKGALLAPTMGRQQSEMLGPMIEREIDILGRQGKLPPMPPVLAEAEGEYRIEYDSPMSRAQKAEAGAGTMRTLQWAGEIAAVTQDPSVMDHFDFDTIIPELADINAMPIRYISDEEQLKQKREGRQEAQETQQLIDAAPSMAAMMKPGVGGG